MTKQLIAEFRLIPFPPMPIDDSGDEHGEEPRTVLLDDRGPQITFEFPKRVRALRGRRVNRCSAGSQTALTAGT